MIPKKSLDSVLDKSIILAITAPNAGDNAKSIPFFPQTFRHTEKSDKGSKGESKGTMKNYQFYLDHYWGNMESLKSEKDLYLMADENTSNGSLWIEPLFLKEAIDILCECR